MTWFRRRPESVAQMKETTPARCVWDDRAYPLERVARVAARMDGEFTIAELAAAADIDEWATEHLLFELIERRHCVRVVAGSVAGPSFSDLTRESR